MTETLSPADRLAKADKVRALRLKTVANGATPDEAASAQAMADRLQDKYGLSASECAPAPTARRAYKSPEAQADDFWADLFKAAAQAQSAEDRVERAKAQYRRNGVHIDEGYHAACRCSSCNDHRAKKAEDFASAYGKPGGFTRTPPPNRETPKPGKARTNGSHANCSHEATSAARARCRKNRAAGI